MKYKIDIKKKVKLNGFLQKIHIVGDDENKPVILFLHGGPGVCNRHTIFSKHLDLLDSFILVAWDQRGTGGSYKNVDKNTLRVSTLIEDAKCLVDYICKTLNKDKIFIVGGSWGTELGTFLANKHPEHIAGYIGYGQVVDGIENENISYEFCVTEAAKANDVEALDTLKRIGPPIKGQYTPVFEGLMAQRKIMTKYGGHSVDKATYWEGTAKPILLSKEYTMGDKWGIIKGYKLCLSEMWPDMCDYNFRTEYNHFEMPYYIFQGRYDKNTPSDLVEEFFDSIEAPEKELIWFEKSAHGVMNEEPKLFKQLLREKFLKIAKN